MCEHGYDEKTSQQAGKTGKKEYSLCESMFISFIITFAAGTICFENYMPQTFTAVYRTVLMLVCAAVWLWYSFYSGIKNKLGFEIFSAVFWLLPQLIMFLSDNGPEFCRMSVTLYLLSEFFSLIFVKPAEIIGMPSLMLAIVMAVLCTLIFFSGKFCPEKVKDGNYTFF